MAEDQLVYSSLTTDLKASQEGKAQKNYLALGLGGGWESERIYPDSVVTELSSCAVQEACAISTQMAQRRLGGVQRHGPDTWLVAWHWAIYIGQFTKLVLCPSSPLPGSSLSKGRSFARGLTAILCFCSRPRSFLSSPHRRFRGFHCTFALLSFK